MGCSKNNEVKKRTTMMNYEKNYEIGIKYLVKALNLQQMEPIGHQVNGANGVWIFYYKVYQICFDVRRAIGEEIGMRVKIRFGPETIFEMIFKENQSVSFVEDTIKRIIYDGDGLPEIEDPDDDSDIEDIEGIKDEYVPPKKLRLYKNMVNDELLIVSGDDFECITPIGTINENFAKELVRRYNTWSWNLGQSYRGSKPKFDLGE